MGGIQYEKAAASSWLFCRVFFVFLAFALASSFAGDEPKAEAENPLIREIFANHSDEDLLNLLACVNYEIECRGLSASNASSQKEVTVPPGEYTVGQDIPKGTYTVEASGIIAVMTVHDADGSIDAMHSVQPGSPIGKLVLKEGQTVEITGVSVVFKPYAGLGF